jgi:soluble lytic murein transglycosylase-like protein
VRTSRLAPLAVVALGALVLAAAVAAEAADERSDATALAAAPPAPETSSPRTCPVPAQYRLVIDAASADTGLPVSLLSAVAHVESGFDHRAVSSAGARGVLQVLPATARSLGFDARHRDEAVLAGARYLRLMYDRFDSMPLALAAYNAGPSAVSAAGGAPSAQVAGYVASVTARWRQAADCA